MNLETPLTLGILFEFTDEVLLPRLSEVIDNRIDEKLKPELTKLEHNLKSYIDDKLADYTSDIFKRLEKRDIKEKEFKRKVVELFKRHDIGTTEDLAFLDGLAI